MQRFKQGLEIWGLQIRFGGASGYLGIFNHSNTIDRTYVLPDISGNILLNTNFLGSPLPALTPGYLQWTVSGWTFSTPSGGGGGSSHSATYSTPIGDGFSTTITVIHNLGTSQITVSIIEKTGLQRLVTSGVDVRLHAADPTNAVDLIFVNPPASSSLQVSIFSGVTGSGSSGGTTSMDPYLADTDTGTSEVYTYNTDGTVNTATATVQGFTRVITYNYNSSGQVTTEVATWNGQTKTKTYSYDPTSGNVTSASVVIV